VSYKAAVAELAAVRDVDSVSAVQTLLAEEFEYLGDAEAAIEHRQAALASAYASGNNFRISMALSEAGSASASRGEMEIAKIIFERLIKTGKRAQNPLIAIDALISYGGILAATGRPSAAARAFGEALALTNESRNPNVRERLHAMVDFRAAEAKVGNTRDNLLRINTAIEFFARSRNNFSQADALLVRSRLLAEFSPKKAEQDIRRGLKLIDRELVSISDPASRTSYLERRQDFFDELVPLLAGEADSMAAFRVADKAHNALLATYRNGAGSDNAIFPADIPRRTAIVEFFISGEQIYRWVITKEAVRGGRLSVTAEYLRRRVKLVEDAIANKRIVLARSLLRELDEVLLQSAIESTHSISRLIVIPDKFLFKLPFAAFVDRNEQYRIKSMEIGMEVSVQHYLDALRRDARRPLRGGSVGIVAVADDATGMSSLPEVAKEAGTLRLLYGKVEVLTRVSSGSAFVDVLGRHAIAHIALHGFEDRRRPLKSGLQIGGTMSITAYELAIARFLSTRLVFLNACRSGAAVEKRTAVGNVSTALLAAGVPAVIGVLWDVQDLDAREMAVAFHIALREGRSPHEALRQAQLEAIDREQHKDDSLVWAGYILVGASTINEEKR
jgi:CHAT domain-containing protein